MKQRHLITWISILLLVISLACNAIQSSPAPTDTPEPTATTSPQPIATAIPEPTPEPPPTNPPTAAPTTTKAPEVETTGASVEIINNSGFDIAELYISDVNAESWGENQLMVDLIPDQTSYTITEIPPGIYDVQAVDADGYVIETTWALDVTGPASWEVVVSAVVEIINETDEDIWYAYISPSESDTWGEDVLGDEILYTGESVVVEGRYRGLYDLRVENADGDHVETQYRVDLQDEYAWVVTGVASLPDNAVLRFEDDFSDNRNDWGEESNESAIYNAPADGEYCIDILVDNVTVWEWYEPFRPDEFIAEVNCGLAPASSATCGIGFGPDGDNLYWFEVSPSDQEYAVFLLQDDVWQDPLLSWTTSYSIHPDGRNYMSFKRIDGVLTVYINGIVQAELDGTRFPTGRIGLGGATYSEGDQRVCLDDLRVWQVE